MTELDTLYDNIIKSETSDEAVNKYYAVFFLTTFYMPINVTNDEQQPFNPLFVEQEGKHFTVAFDTLERFEQWAGDKKALIDHVGISGADIIRCMSSERVYVCINPNNEYYKQFSPDEIGRLKIMIARIDRMKDGGQR